MKRVQTSTVPTSDEVATSIVWRDEVYDSELGLVYYNYRSYNPTDGRWINRDPIGIQGGMNLYAFVGNRVWLWDLLGLKLDEKWHIDIENFNSKEANLHIHYDNKKYQYHADTDNRPRGFYDENGKGLPKEARKKLADKQSKFARDLASKIRSFNKTSELAQKYGGGRICLSAAITFFLADLPELTQNYLDAIEGGNVAEMHKAYGNLINSIPEIGTGLSMSKALFMEATKDIHREIIKNVND